MTKQRCTGIWRGCYPPAQCQGKAGHRGQCWVSPDGHPHLREKWWGKNRQSWKVRLKMLRRHLMAIDRLLVEDRER